ncbi:hypothetical protein Sjap_019096 [Stephania japonica]|uniref:Pentatricopeptide repeat-containing protein n=1 Tax=Stephania japonica TaxID=461633 RepID=A0AAP0F0Y2_9MAGN
MLRFAASVPQKLFSVHRFFSNQSWLSLSGNPLINWPQQQQQQQQQQDQIASPSAQSDKTDCALICSLLRNPNLSGPSLEPALENTGINPIPTLLHQIFTQFDSSPKPLFTLFKWAQKNPSFRPTPSTFNAMIDLLAKSRSFHSAWSLILDRLNNNGYQSDSSSVISTETFAILIRRYARAGMTSPAIRTFEFAQNLNESLDLDSKSGLFEVMLDSLCKEGHVRVGSEYCDRKKAVEPDWVPSVRVYNILINGWFRLRKLKHAERVWESMRRDNVAPSVVTYGTLVEGYCRMRRVERAMELIDEMRREGIEPNVIVCNPVVDALGEAGRFKEAMGMLERLSVLEEGPTISTYNSLVKGFCKAGNLVSASKILKMMIGKGLVPTPTTYNYFFRYFSKFGKIEEGMNLYTKMIESGYEPDRLTYHLLIKMLCEQERLELAMQVAKEMRARGYDLDLATSTMLIHLLCKLHRFEEACGYFEDVIRRGLVPQYLTYRKLIEELKIAGMHEMARKLSDKMALLRHSTKLPNTYREGDRSRDVRTSIMRKAEAMSDILKKTNDPKELSKLRDSSDNVVSSANQLIENIRRRFVRS